MSAFQPELGQIAHRPFYERFEVPEYACALFEYILCEIERVYGNRRQEPWNRYDDPALVDGMEYRPFYWGDDEAEAMKPNFAWHGVEIHWYKHPGRSMSSCASLTPDEWVDWFNDAVAAIQAADGPSEVTP